MTSSMHTKLTLVETVLHTVKITQVVTYYSSNFPSLHFAVPMRCYVFCPHHAQTRPTHQIPIQWISPIPIPFIKISRVQSVE